jgi:hypothetical protein
MEEIGINSELLYGILIVIGVGFVLAMILMFWVLWRVRRINIPADADFFTALRATPFVVVLLLDLLDLSLDVFSAPVTWFLLGKLGLKPLRTVTVVEGLIPGTHLLPTMTLAWIMARLGFGGK